MTVQYHQTIPQSIVVYKLGDGLTYSLFVYSSRIIFYVIKLVYIFLFIAFYWGLQGCTHIQSCYLKSESIY